MLDKLNKILMSENVVNDFKKELQNNEFRNYLKINLPEILECENFKQNTEWHIHDVLTHILYSVKHINKQTVDLDYKDRRMLCYVMLFHDIGKPKSKTQDFKNGKFTDHFKGHNKISKEIAQKRLANFGFEKETLEKMFRLIEEHDSFMFLRLFPTTNPELKTLDKNVVLNQVKKLNSVGNGLVLCDYLTKIGMADNKSQNPEKTEESLKLIQKYQSILKDLASYKI